MSEMIVYQEPQPLTAQQIRAQVNTIQQVMREVMQDGIHYGKIPGCGDKPALLKPGAEKILTTFRVAAEPEVHDLSTADEVKYRVHCRGVSATGRLIGIGVGECSSNEEKYRWRKAVCTEEYEETPEDRRRAKWCRGKDGGYQVQQVRTVPADVANTVLKMAKKRAMVDLCLTATAASDIFTQDLDEDDLPRENGNGHAPQPPQRKPVQQEPPRESREGEPLISDPQRKRFYAIAKQSGKSDQQIKDYLLGTYGIEHTADITKSIYEDAVSWAQS